MRYEPKIILLSQVFVVSFFCASGIASENVSESCDVHWVLSSLELRNPEQDANAAIRRGDPVFLGVYGYALEIPGVQADSYCLRDAGLLWVIPDTGDDLRCEEHERAVEAAVEFARVYNNHLLSKNALGVPARCAA